MMTMYLNWNDTTNSSRLDVGVANEDYIADNWTTHETNYTKFNDYTSKVPTLPFKNVTYNGTIILNKTATLVPFNLQPYAVTFGANFKDDYEAL